MGLARGLERRLERLVEGLTAAVFRGRIHPVDLANRLVREADLAVREEDAGPTVPNEYAITVATGDLDEAIDRDDLVSELAATVEATAADRGWRLEGPVKVTLVERAGTSGVEVTLTSTTGNLPPWGWLLAPGGSDLPVRPNRAVVGRGPECDLRFDDPEVSRLHAVIWRESGRVWLIDLGSSNGTTVNGVPVDDITEVSAGDLLSFGPVPASFKAS